MRQLPPGTVELQSEMIVRASSDVRGATSGTVLRAARNFRGRALIVCSGGPILLRNFTVDGNRAALEVRTGLPSAAFAVSTPHNGVLASGADGLRIEGVSFREIAGFAILVSHSKNVAIDGVADLQSVAAHLVEAVPREAATGVPW